MADDPQPDPQQPEIETVQHPILGTLKFPKDMGPDERNEVIQRHLAERPNAGLAPPAGAPPSRLDAAQKMDAGQPSPLGVLTQPTEKTDKEYLGYTGPAGVAGATIHGMSDVARGTKGALEGTWNSIRHPVEAAKGIAQLPRMASEVPAAMRDINQSADPVGHYLNTAQDTASQGAGQALTALGTMGVARMVPPAIRLAARSAESGINQKLIPIRPILNLGTPADDAAAIRLKVPGRDLGLTKPMYPGAPEPSAPPRDFLQRNAMMGGGFVDPGAPLPEVPPRYPGAPLPAKPPAAVMQARGLSAGARPPEMTSGVLGRIPVVPSEPEPVPFSPKGKMGGRYVLTPEEVKQAEAIQKIALQRARERGMQYAAGMKPSGAKIPTP
jgi:hypothetical protein